MVVLEIIILLKMDPIYQGDAAPHKEIIGASLRGYDDVRSCHPAPAHAAHHSRHLHSLPIGHISPSSATLGQSQRVRHIIGRGRRTLGKFSAGWASTQFRGQFWVTFKKIIYEEWKIIFLKK